MSLAFATVVPGVGIAVAADSRTTTIDASGRFGISTDYTKKLFQVGNCAVSTTGWNLLLGKTIAQHVSELPLPDPVPNVAGIAFIVAAHFQNLYSQHVAATGQRQQGGGIVLEFLVAGQEQTTFAVHRATVFDVGPNPGLSVPAPVLLPTPPEPSRFDVVRHDQTAWSGEGATLRRLLLGYDPVVPVPPMVANQLAASAPIIPYDTFTLQDAVNFSRFCVELTAHMQRFSFGYSRSQLEPTSVGGHVDVAVVDGSGFRWISEKRLTTSQVLSDPASPQPSQEGS